MRNNKKNHQWRGVLTALAIALGGMAAPISAMPVGWEEAGKPWLSQGSPHFTIHYVQGHQDAAERALDIAEQVHRDLRPFFSTMPAKKTEIVLVDDFDFSNGWATPLPFAQIRLYMSPPEEGSDLAFSDEWLHMLIRHEYVHIAHMELAAGAPKALQNVFGRQGFLFPHALTPSMLIEGLAVYLESNPVDGRAERGYGRLQSTNYAMKIRMEAASGELKPLNQVVVADREWPLGYQYLYGAYFVQYLVQTYGEEKVSAFLDNYSRRLIPYFLINRTARQTFGKDFEALWLDFSTELEVMLSAELRQASIDYVGGHSLDHSELLPFLQVMAASHEGLLLNRNNGEDRTRVERWQPQFSDELQANAKPRVNTNQGNWQTLVSSKNITSLDSHPSGGIIATRQVNRADGRAFNDIYLLREGRWQALTERERFKQVRWLADGKHLLAMRKVSGISELWQLDATNPKQRTLLWQANKGEVLGSFDVSNDGKHVIAALQRHQQGWNLEQLDIGPEGDSQKQKKQKQWTPITNTKAHESSPTYLPDGRVLFSADYDGVFDVYALDIASGNLERWTREIGGALKPVWQPELGLVYQSYGSQGYEVKLLAEPQALSNVQVSEYQAQYDYPDVVQQPAEKGEPKPYQPWKTVRPHNWLPLAYIDDVRTQIGAFTFGSDALGQHNYTLSALWDTDNDVGDFTAIYQYDNRWLAILNSSHSYDKLTLGDQSGYRITRDDYLLLQRSHLFNAFEDQLSLHAGVYIDSESLVSQPNFASAFRYREIKESLVGLAVTFDNRESYLNVPGIGWGHYFDAVAETNEVINSDYEGQKYQAQWNVTWDLPGRTTLTARLAGGYADDGAQRFGIGGTDIYEERRLFGRDSQAIRGYDDNAQRGDRYFTQRLSLTSHLARVERNWALFPIGLGDISGTAFVDSGAAWDSGESLEQLTGTGVELTVEAKLGYGLRFPVTVGYAYGFDDELGKDEFYLRVSSLF
ncbi:hypothetical protein C9I98_06630 [Photobacterium sanctipauli]|uniref:Bacterial surface antigen (D15) domain-containing protein n=3 Tax=Photobacterium sanctipauli TaxID=1342794 RepID=A0A2T3NWC6_9GAMM|nr:hypothetical protein C9I98_06630 [Photobacterium sanctipauli]